MIRAIEKVVGNDIAAVKSAVKLHIDKSYERILEKEYKKKSIFDEVWLIFISIQSIVLLLGLMIYIVGKNIRGDSISRNNDTVKEIVFWTDANAGTSVLGKELQEKKMQETILQKSAENLKEKVERSIKTERVEKPIKKEEDNGGSSGPRFFSK